MIEPHRRWIMLEDQCRPEFMFGEPFPTKHTRMLEHFQQFRFASCRTLNR
jgi:hypothetical protein